VAGGWVGRGFWWAGWPLGERKGVLPIELQVLP